LRYAAGKNDDACKKQKRYLQQFGSHSVVLNSDLMQERFSAFRVQADSGVDFFVNVIAFSETCQRK
jgi:hypothetical protein